MLFECEKMADRRLSADRKITNDVTFTVCVEKEGDLIQITGKGETFVSTKQPIVPIDSLATGELPNIFPMKHTISMPQTNIYKLADHYR